MKDIIIIGAGGFAKEVAFLLEDINKNQNEWNILGYSGLKKGETNGKYSVVYTDDEIINFKKEINVVFGIGDPQLIKKLAIKFSINKFIKFPNVIHHNVVGDFDNINIGKGNVICSSNIFTTDISIGNFNIFNLNNTIGHDTIIGDFNIFNPSCNISGGCNLKNQILCGTGCQILQYLKIESNTIIGAGSVVTKNITESGTYVGIPAKKIK